MDIRAGKITRNYDFTKRTDSFRPDHFLIIALTGGSRNIRWRGDWYTIGAGDIQLYYPGESYFNKQAVTRFRGYNLMINFDSETSPWPAPPAVPVICDTREWVLESLREIWAEQSADPESSGEKNRYLSQAVISHFYRTAVSRDDTESEGTIVTRIKRLIREDPGKSWHQEEMARHLGLSASGLKWKIRRETGGSYSRLLKTIRTEEAKALIRWERELSFTEIAEILGFCDVYYFSRVFKEIEGISPRAYSLSIRSPG